MIMKIKFIKCDKIKCIKATIYKEIFISLPRDNVKIYFSFGSYCLCISISLVNSNLIFFKFIWEYFKLTGVKELLVLKMSNKVKLHHKLLWEVGVQHFISLVVYSSVTDGSWQPLNTLLEEQQILSTWLLEFQISQGHLLHEEVIWSPFTMDTILLLERTSKFS